MIVRGPDAAIHRAIATLKMKSSCFPTRASQVVRPVAETCGGALGRPRRLICLPRRLWLLGLHGVLPRFERARHRRRSRRVRIGIVREAAGKTRLTRAAKA
jgi:hypothetical protein